MKIETLEGIAHTARCMDIMVSLVEEGLMFELARGRHAVSGLVPWRMLEETRDPHGLCAITMGDIFKAMEVAQGDDAPRVVRPSHWQGTGRSGNGGDM
jgi:hypothetical protein